jgi:tRNA(Ile)-lysidine synthase
MVGSRKSPSIEVVRSAVADCLGRHAPSGQRLIVGFSGGIDSVVLLHALRGVGITVSAFHVHHGLSQFADAWAAFCRKLCAAWQIALTVERVVVERTSVDGQEAAARRARHEAYDRVAADWLLLAHHQDDRAETMLFNLLRGAGVRGAGALGERNGRILRPLLSVNRAQIRAYADSESLRWVEDESNADTRFSRNFLRHRVLPVVEERFPAAASKLASAAKHFAEGADLLDELALLDMGSEPPGFPVEIGVLARLSEPRARNVLRFLLSRAGVGIPSEDRLIEALRQCLSAAPDRRPAICFGGRILRRRRGRLFLELRSGSVC